MNKSRSNCGERGCRRKSPVFVRVADGIYKFRDHFYYRPKKPDGRRTWRSLDARTLKAAKLARQKLAGQQLESSLTIADAVSDYVANSCPDRNRQARTLKYFTLEQSRCANLLKFFAGAKCSDLTHRMLDDYADWRMKSRARGNHGGRAADLDIVALKNAMRWATRRGLIQCDPFETLTVSSYRKPQIRHCRECAPRSGDELHGLAETLFEEKRSAIMGWLTLITAMVGCRVSEMTSLRTDAKEGEPGNITDGTLWLRRKKHGAYPFLRVHPALAQCLKAFWSWRSERYKNAVWWFPGRTPAKPIREQSLTHALRRVGKLVTGETRTAHGLRSFYVTVRRSQGASDAEIALETGHVSGGREIVRTYGDATPKKISWLPSKGKPAWVELYHNYTTADLRKAVSKKRKIVSLTRYLRDNRRVSVSAEKTAK